VIITGTRDGTHPPQDQEVPVDTRMIAVLALVIAVVVLLIILL
jgi:hypothetical protein